MLTKPKKATMGGIQLLVRPSTNHGIPLTQNIIDLRHSYSYPTTCLPLQAGTVLPNHMKYIICNPPFLASPHANVQHIANIYYDAYRDYTNKGKGLLFTYFECLGDGC